MPFPLTAQTALGRALSAWYRRDYPLHPERRAHAVAADFGISPTLLYRYTQLDIARFDDAGGY